MSEVRKIKPSLSKGTRDFLPSEVAKRNYIFNTIKSVLRKYGFEEIETPAIEKLETLTGKYGEEGDKLLFKILNSGDYLSEIRSKKTEIASLTSQEITPMISEKGLRYDLTVPLARYVVQHQDDLAFPFKRFHIGPVWRADRPQKGRYQEFYQCDADVIGSNSLLNEVELTKIYLEVYEKLGIQVSLRMNSRKILEALAEYASCKELLTEITVVIDKLDKIGIEGVKNELSKLNLSAEQQQKISSLLQTKSLEELTAVFENIEIGKKGIEELNFVFKNTTAQNLVFDITLARGLNYYTGVIWEVVFSQSTIGSLGGGGRYDNLTEMFGGQNMSGVGISFGIERIYDVLEELQLFPENITQGVKVLFVPREESVEEFTFQQVQMLRDAGIPAEIFLGNVKKQKQFNYVEQKHIAYIVEIGGNEVESGRFRLRNSQTRDTEQDLTISDIISRLS
ncbi:MAG: histidine--tRNA ligase [Bacteroidetes bacterium]|nr:histidine--tRNA ligase [Bacteroidota bacterium]